MSNSIKRTHSSATGVVTSDAVEPVKSIDAGNDVADAFQASLARAGNNKDKSPQKKEGDSVLDQIGRGAADAFRYKNPF